MNFSGPTWRIPGQESVLLASRRYDGSTSRKTKGSMADTLQCNLWRRAQTPDRMTHSLHGGGNHDHNNGFTALSKTIGTNKATPKDSEYVEEHSVLKYLRGKLACHLHDYRSHWFSHLRLPPPNGRHNQLSGHQVRRLMRRVLQRSGFRGGGRGRERPEIQVFSSLDIGHKDFLGEQSTASGQGATTPKQGWTLSSSSPRPLFTRGPLPILNPPWTTAGSGAWCSCAVSG